MQPPSEQPGSQSESERLSNPAEALERQGLAPKPAGVNPFERTLTTPVDDADPFPTWNPPSHSPPTPPTPITPPILDGWDSIDAAHLPATLNPVAKRPDPFSTCTPTGTASNPFALPEVPGYEVVKELGRGGMGVVYLARQKGLQRQVALKMMLTKHSRQSDLDRFRLEAAALARLQHSGIIQIYEVGEHDGQPYFSLEFAPGGSLDSQVRGSPQSPLVSAELMEGLARAMHAAHEAGVIHRDLKPANILLSPLGREVPEEESAAIAGRDNRDRMLDLKRWQPKITDFGLAKCLDEELGHTQSGDVMGTPCYMAPEQAQGRTREVGPCSDIYTLGAILYELLTGRPPFLGEHTWDTLSQVVQQEPVPPSRFQLRVPRDLETICLKCLEKSALRRYRTAADLADDLRRFREGRPIQARPLSPVGRAVKLVKRRPLASALSLAIVLLLTGVGFFSIAHLQQRALLAEQDYARLQRSEDDRTKVRLLLHDAETAARGRDWREAQSELDLVFGLLKGNADLEDFRPGAEQLQGQVRAGSGAESTLQTFRKHCEDARFHQTQMTGLEFAANVEKVRTESRAALALVGMGDERQATPVLGPGFTDAEKEEIAAACYEQYLALAAAVAQPLALHNEDAREQAGKALVLLTRAQRLGRAPTRALHLQRAICLAQRGDKAAADKETAAALALAPADAQDFFLLGLESFRQKDYDDALKQFGQALAKQDNLYWPRYLSGLCHVKQLARGRNQALDAVRELTTCANQRPASPWPFLTRGHVHTESGDHAAAEDDFARAEKVARSSEERYTLSANRGSLRYRQGRTAEAIADFEQAIRLHPDNYQAHQSLALAAQQMKDFDRALKEHDLALKHAANLQIEDQPRVLASIYRSRAVLNQLYRQKKDEALQDFADAARLSADVRDHIERGRILIEERRFEAALPALDEALKVKADDPTAHYLRAVALVDLQRPAEALPAINRSLAKGQPTADACALRGRIKASLGKYVEAIEDYSQALKLKADAGTRSHRGWAYLMADAPQFAERDFEEVIKLKADDADACNGRATALVKQGKYRPAVKDAEEAVRLNGAATLVLYKAGRVFALAVSRVETDTNEPNRAVLMREYQDRAMVLLRQALEALPPEQQAKFWHDQVQKDTAFTAVYRSTAFLRLRADYGKALR